jgi:hypothetical protein
MSHLENKKVDLAKVFRKGGLLLPLNESEIEDFEKNLNRDDAYKPIDWDNPLKILERGKIKSVALGKLSIDDSTVNNLAMAARDGKKISDDIRKRMNEDRKKDRKQ